MYVNIIYIIMMKEYYIVNVLYICMYDICWKNSFLICLYVYELVFF